IIEKWDVLTAIMDEELPSAEEIEKLLRKIGVPVTAGEMGMEEELLPICFKATKDIRDKYVLSRLAWDLGLLDEMAERL
ncbi:MAG: sn-glycerol-1-phosphate dehydrogenase, partial [Firmicutes bacterium]|nr:sn-glycerol-1-phosphate dehydrogenase [Bacillota bacterium]